MRILWVQPDPEYATGLHRWNVLEPLGLEMIGAALKGRHHMALLDMRLARGGLAAALADERPHVVGISSTFTMGVRQTLDIAESVKAAAPQTFVIVGGHHPSLSPEDYAHPAVDAIVVGEGELTTQELVECLDAGDDPVQVPGLVVNRPEGQCATGSRSPVGDLDLLPLPDRSLTRLYRARYHQAMVRPVASVETTRGCPYRCRFCAVWPFYQGQVRFKSPARVVEELAAVAEPNVFFTDDNFLVRADRAVEIAGLIRARDLRQNYYMQLRSDAIVRFPEIIGEWQEVGLRGVFIGFESPNQEGLERVNKHASVESNEQALDILRRHGIEPAASFIVDPSFGRDDFASLRDYVRRLKLKWPLFAVLTPLPGTALFEEMRERLTTSDYGLFDLVHAVLPTRLPLAEFYQELARLWQTAYPRWKVRLGRALLPLGSPFVQDWRSAQWRRILTGFEQLIDARVYMKDHARPVNSTCGRTES